MLYATKAAEQDMAIQGYTTAKENSKQVSVPLIEQYKVAIKNYAQEA